MPRLVRVHDSQLLNDRFDLIGYDQLKDSTHAYLAAVKNERLRQLLDSWDASLGVSSLQTVQEVDVSCLFDLHLDYSVFDLSRH